MNSARKNKSSSHIEAMVQKLDERHADGIRGHYVTQVPELLGILSELTPLISVGIKKGLPTGDRDLIPVEVKLSFTLSRAELAELAKAQSMGNTPPHSFSWFPSA